MQKSITIILLLIVNLAVAQKKPLDHQVYDNWESIGSKQLSDNGIWAAYNVAKQEGDAMQYFQNLNSNQKVAVPRATGVKFSGDTKFAAFMIKPQFQETRAARIKKKKGDDMPKDSLGYINLTSNAVTKIGRVKSFQIPEAGTAMMAYLMEKADTIKKVAAAASGSTTKTDSASDRAEDDKTSADKNTEGTDLIFKNLITGTIRTFKYVTDYAFSKNGKQLIFASSGSKKEKAAPAGVFVYNTEKGGLKTLIRQKGTFKNFVFDEDGEQLAFVGETSPEKQEVKEYHVYYNSVTLDTAQILVDNEIPGMPAKWSVSSDGKLVFSKDARKLFFGIAPVRPPKDTTLVDFENAKLDIWGYKDDYLQPMQLKNLDKELKRSYLTVIDIFNSDPKIVPLADLMVPDASLISKGDALYALATSDAGNRVQMQWTAESIRDVYLVDVKTGQRRKILSGINGEVKASPDGKYIVYFDKNTSGWYSYIISSGQTQHLNKDLKVTFADEENDVPAQPSAYGIAGWAENDKTVYIYDRYDIWAFSPDGKGAPKNVTNGFGRQQKITLRYQKLDPEETFIIKGSSWLAAFNNTTKENGFFRKDLSNMKDPDLVVMAAFKFSDLVKAKNADRLLYEKANYTNSPNVYSAVDMKAEVKLSATNPQQQNYNWGTAELVKWTTPKGYNAEGILYKPENFDPNKKYPMIVYFYEKLSDGLYTYQAPAPTPSRLNIPYFVSNGYLVFAPDISYETGYPGKSAVEFINSGVESLKKNSWVDGKKIGIQGQSWGGYQVAYLITQTDMYAAAWAGAPVVNMTSAYGGMRWESGMSRQFQYEKTQSRIGATLWEKPELYIENSPLFYLPKVNTPVAIMSNDADGAVPYYQGIEMFTGLRRLGKPAWLLVYNNEAHNLVQRQNRKDISIREQQFFDHYLKGAKVPKWMVSGVPATEKGVNWGFELTDAKP